MGKLLRGIQRLRVIVEIWPLRALPTQNGEKYGSAPTSHPSMILRKPITYKVMKVCIE